MTTGPWVLLAVPDDGHSPLELVRLPWRTPLTRFADNRNTFFMRHGGGPFHLTVHHIDDVPPAALLWPRLFHRRKKNQR